MWKFSSFIHVHIYFLFYVLLIVHICLNSLKDKCTIFTSEVYCFYQDFTHHSIFSDNITTWLLLCFIRNLYIYFFDLTKWYCLYQRTDSGTKNSHPHYDGVMEIIRIDLIKSILSQRCKGDNSNWLNKILHWNLLGQYQPIILRDLT